MCIHARCDNFQCCCIYIDLCPTSELHITAWMSSPPDWIEYVPALQDEHAEEPAAMTTMLGPGKKNQIPANTKKNLEMNGILYIKYTKWHAESNIHQFLSP
jgi:hypothetical protein